MFFPFLVRIHKKRPFKGKVLSQNPKTPSFLPKTMGYLFFRFFFHKARAGSVRAREIGKLARKHRNRYSLQQVYEIVRDTKLLEIYGK
jgi:hypothetical protein